MHHILFPELSSTTRLKSCPFLVLLNLSLLFCSGVHLTQSNLVSLYHICCIGIWSAVHCTTPPSVLILLLSSTCQWFDTLLPDSQKAPCVCNLAHRHESKLHILFLFSFYRLPCPFLRPTQSVRLHPCLTSLHKYVLLFLDIPNKTVF